MSSPYKHQLMFSPERYTLMQEANKHPELVKDLIESNRSPDDWGGTVGDIAAYCHIGMEGDYMPHELDKLCAELYFILRKYRQEMEKIYIGGVANDTDKST